MSRLDEALWLLGVTSKTPVMVKVNLIKTIFTMAKVNKDEELIAECQMRLRC
ncbi:hypothetical protein M2G93_16965 [Vibrio vulnificus]|uniref:hypothetical protein n=1 Tax=Vibrio vulnificus TaxID=672 RepID=UPI0021D88EE4|nr:hypothetical protein [Vibrio vulnificus]EKZ9225812.1 hypothetical protein [Vibrio vulnificus]MCU8149808.1 hypothetical protein [Vibrio vulnificus]MCU8385865.1 hypothetical protein [Vibrio vulnificus]